MNRTKQISGILLCILMILLSPVAALAAGNIDLSREVSLTVLYQNNDTPLIGAEFSVYLVATVNEQAELTPVEAFSRYSVEIQSKDEETWKTLASTLEGYVLRDAVPPAGIGVTDAQGKVTFPADGNTLTPGLYLVLGSRHIQDGYRYDAMPFVVMLPSLDRETGAWVYDVETYAKNDFAPVSGDTVARKVIKVWKDNGYKEERPQEVVVQLLRDGNVFDTVTLHAGNNWRYSWEGLDSRYSWTVVEKELRNYTVKIVREGITFIITNTHPNDKPDDPPPVIPQTGQLWWPVPLLVCGGLLFIVMGLIVRRGAAYEEKE
ncbi:MAG: Cna B-type domain-containing protein [Christensenellales bacterium]